MQVPSTGLLALLALAAQGVDAAPRTAASIDGTYQLTRRVLANGKTLVPPDVRAIYTLRSGHFSLNLFFKNSDGTLASESTIGRFSFNTSRYCEWIEATTRNNIDHPGVTNEIPKLSDHCARVSRIGGNFVFVDPGENVTSHFGPDGFVAMIDNGDRDYWTKLK